MTSAPPVSTLLGAAVPGVVILGAAVLGLGCGDAVSPLPREGVPQELEFSVGSFDAGSSGWELRDDTLVFRRIPPDANVSGVDTVRRVPSAEEWQSFWTAAAEAGVRNWSGEYRAEGVVDGTGWSLLLEVGGVRIEAQGSNAYPDAEGRESELEPTSAFRGFRSALEDLAGNPTLQASALAVGP